MANQLVSTTNNTEPMALRDLDVRDDFAIASGVFVKGEVVSITAPNTIVKYDPATKAPLAVMAQDADASGGALTDVSAYTKGYFAEDKLTFNTTAATTTAVYGPTLTTRDALRLVNIELVKTESVDS